MHLEKQLLRKCEIAPIDSVASPLGYRTEYTKSSEKDFDGRFEWLPMTSEIRIDSEQTDITLKSVANTNLLIGNNEYPEKGVVNTINTNKGKLFSLQKSKKEEGWYDPNYVNFKGAFDFDPETQRDFALISSKVTGVSPSENGRSRQVNMYTFIITFLSLSLLIPFSYNINIRCAPEKPRCYGEKHD